MDSLSNAATANLFSCLFSCVGNGKLQADGGIGVPTTVLKGVDVTEVFSPQRVTKRCAKYGCIAGVAFDLREGTTYLTRRRSLWSSVESGPGSRRWCSAAHIVSIS